MSRNFIAFDGMSVREILPVLLQVILKLNATDAFTVLSKLVENVDMLEQLRLLSIGAPKLHRSSTLPPNHVWLNGDFVEFENWPEFKAVYDAGDFGNVMLPWNASAATIAANKGAYRPDAARPTGLYLPILGDEFLRLWTVGIDRKVGSTQKGAMVNLKGTFSTTPGTAYHGTLSRFALTNLTGVFSGIDQTAKSYASGGWEGSEFKTTTGVFDASRQVATANEFRPDNTSWPVIAYVGRSKKELLK